MHGDSFCTASRECFDMITGNAFTVVTVDWFTGLVLFIGNFFGTVVTTLGAVSVMMIIGRDISPITIGVIVVVSYLIFSLFATIISTGVDTVFVCYIEEQENARNGKGLYISPELHTEFVKRKQINN